MDGRLSHAFPPEEDDENQTRRGLVGEVHQELKGIPKYKLTAIRNNVIFSTEVKYSHLLQLKDLHKEFFPIDYEENFYNRISTGDLRVVNCLGTLRSTLG